MLQLMISKRDNIIKNLNKYRLEIDFVWLIIKLVVYEIMLCQLVNDVKLFYYDYYIFYYESINMNLLKSSLKLRLMDFILGVLFLILYRLI